MQEIFMKQVNSAGIVVYRTQNNVQEYLLLHYQAGHWDFPKGKVESGESHQEAALRELSEEAGITSTIMSGFEHTFSYVFHDYDGLLAKKTVYFFVGETQSNHITLSHEHQDFIWLPYQEACQKLTYANAKTLLDDVHTFLNKNIQ